MTTTLPVVAPVGTGTAMLVADQLVGVAAVPLNVTVLLPCVAPKLVPAIVTAVPTGPLVGDTLVRLGAIVTVYGNALLVRPPTVTTTLPVVAPRVAPKLVPVIVTVVPSGPLVGYRLVRPGAMGTS